MVLGPLGSCGEKGKWGGGVEGGASRTSEGPPRDARHTNPAVATPRRRRRQLWRRGPEEQRGRPAKKRAGIVQRRASSPASVRRLSARARARTASLGTAGPRRAD